MFTNLELLISNVIIQTAVYQHHVESGDPVAESVSFDELCKAEDAYFSSPVVLEVMRSAPIV